MFLKCRCYPNLGTAICRRSIHARFHFMDGQFRALEFDSLATTEEVNNNTCPVVLV